MADTTITKVDGRHSPRGAEHSYRILEEFTAVEATSPPAEVHRRDKG